MEGGREEGREIMVKDSFQNQQIQYFDDEHI